MRRATEPVEILLGFAAGSLATLVVQLPFVWFLHLLRLTALTGFSFEPTAPMGVEETWSRVFWGGVFGIALAAWGVALPLGRRWFVSSMGCIVAARTVADWFAVPMFYGRVWAGWGVDSLLMPVVINMVWGVATAILLAAATLAMGTWGTKSLI